MSAVLAWAAVGGGAVAGTAPASGPAVPPADRPVPRGDANSAAAHTQLLAKARRGRIDVYFAGDSITRRWGAIDRPDLLAHWRRSFFGWNAADFGWGGDSTQHILWRLTNGELDGVRPKVIVLLAGTNNIGNRAPPEGPDARAAAVAKGVEAILGVMRDKAPEATVVLTAVFPRADNPAVMPTIDRLNDRLAALADGKRVRFLNVNAALTDGSGRLRPGVMDPDGLHPTVTGYQAWADGLKPILTELLGPPGKEDHAPPPTGDPKVAGRPASRPER